jgi:hypothetical protein
VALFQNSIGALESTSYPLLLEAVLLRRNRGRSLCLLHYRSLVGGAECAEHKVSQDPGDSRHVELWGMRPPLATMAFALQSARGVVIDVVVNAINDILQS